MGYRRGGGRQPEFPKPFDFVPFVDRIKRQARPGHDSFHTVGHLSGRLEYELEVMGMLHVSSGSYALTEDLGMKSGGVVRDCYRVLHHGELLPAVPGSTLKGASRAVIEAVTASCLGVTRVNRGDLPQGLKGSCQPAALCPACGLFGAMSRLGRLSFGDAIFISGKTGVYPMPALFGPRPQQGASYRAQNRQYKGRKFYFHGRLKRHQGGVPVEVLAAPTRLAGFVDFTGLEPAELGLLFFSLGLDGTFQLALGAGKPVAMGRVRFHPQALHVWPAEAFTQYDTGEEIFNDARLTQAISDYLAETGVLLMEKQVASLRQILDPNNPREAPTGVY